MLIRKATEKDLRQVAELFDAYRVFYHKKSDLGAAKVFLRERLTAKDSVIFVCENQDDKLVGFTQLYPLFSSTRMKRLWLLNDLFVDPDSRGKGVSIRLIERAKELAKDTDACGLILETGKNNKVGNKLYPKMGFTLNEASNFYEWDVL
jgi:GNAT superfamily N-acetyltransferase